VLLSGHWQVFGAYLTTTPVVKSVAYTRFVRFGRFLKGGEGCGESFEGPRLKRNRRAKRKLSNNLSA